MDSPPPIHRVSRHEALLSQAALQLNAVGVSQTALADLAEQAGVGRSALYHYFADRQDMVFQCYKRSCEILEYRLAEAAGVPGSALDRLAGFVSATLAATGADFAALSEVGFLTPDQRETIQRAHEGNRARMAALIVEGQATDVIRPCEPDIVARTILSMVYWVPIAQRWTVGPATLRRDRMVKALLQILRTGIATEPSESAPFSRLAEAPPPDASVFDRASLNRARREALLNAASRQFNQKGLDATSMEDIAAAAGATKRAILYHFGDKAALIGACYDRTFELFVRIARRAGEMPGLAAEGLAAAWFAACDAHLRDDLRPLTPMAGFEKLDLTLQARIEASLQVLGASYRDLMVRGQADGSVRDVDANAVLVVIAGAYNWMAKEMDGAREADRRKICEEVSMLFLRGLAP
ncbi:TetR/AcrR family transcriptional regulator [Phenylobacterium sp.]|uniref:TetR/AcrR family transcriptional regulator n=1 Tax=Phenylobacterium sp. TaxID=1871053 RepID=UPI002FCB9A9D